MEVAARAVHRAGVRRHVASTRSSPAQRSPRARSTTTSAASRRCSSRSSARRGAGRRATSSEPCATAPTRGRRRSPGCGRSSPSPQERLPTHRDPGGPGGARLRALPRAGGAHAPSASSRRSWLAVLARYDLEPSMVETFSRVFFGAMSASGAAVSTAEDRRGPATRSRGRSSSCWPASASASAADGRGRDDAPVPGRRADLRTGTRHGPSPPFAGTSSIQVARRDR